MEMHGLQIPMEEVDGSWKQRCYNRMERLKAREFQGIQKPTSHQEEFSGERNFEIFQQQKAVQIGIFQLQKAVQIGNVDRFMDVLVQLCSEEKLPLSAIFDQVTSAGDSLFHEAAYFGGANIAELIGHHFPDLLTKTNIKGDTPLHVAARSKCSNVIKVILSQYYVHAHKLTKSRENYDKDEEITKMTNQYGNTALHEAVGSKHVEGVTLLFEADKYVAHYLNKSEKSPLYLAILSSSKDIVDILLEAPFPDDKSLPKCHGNSPLHAAIYRKNTDLVKDIVEKKPDLMYLRDEDGGTPLHYAAITGYVEGTHILIKKSFLTALKRDSKGQLPIHLACKFGHMKVLKEFLHQEWADPRVLLNKKGQNILHVAAKNGRENVVQYLLKNTKFIQFIINEKDKNGNTPLHLAAKNTHRFVLLCLTEDKNIDINLMNNKGLTAQDTVLLKNTPMRHRQWLSNAIFLSAGAQISCKAQGMLAKWKDREVAREEGLKDRMSSLMVVAILIVAVTFTAGLTVPGGFFGSDYPDPRRRGMPILGNRSNFKGFLAFDIMAMFSSAFGATMLLWAQLGDDIDLGLIFLRIGRLTVGFAICAMIVAFTSAAFLIVIDASWLTRFTAFFCSVLFFLVFGVFGPYIVCWYALGQFTISLHRVLLVLRRGFVLIKMKRYEYMAICYFVNLDMYLSN